MSAGCVRWLLHRAIASSSPVVCWAPLPRSTRCKDRSSAFTFFLSRATLCTAVEDTQATPTPKKKQSGHNNAYLKSRGRMITHRLIQLIGESGDDMGTMHREDVIRLMEAQGLKLMLVSEKKDPPIYKLLSGRQYHEEQLKLQEKKKEKPAPVQVKELTFSSNIATHDLSNKFKQAESWLEKKHHVRITLRRSRHSTDNMDTTLKSLLQQLEVDFGFVSQPTAIQNGQAAMCILRPLSAKELARKSKKTETAESSSESSSTSPVSTKDTSETSVQQ